MLNRKLIAPIVAAFALSIWGCGPAIAQSPDATANPRTPNERSSDSAPTPSYGVDRTNRDTAAPGTVRSRPESRSFNLSRRDQQSSAQMAGDPNDKNNND